ncbi:MAG: sigma-70 family RNA polymerase sigma factor [Thermoguttaceae bacterium]|nr:sigma-70 family RNA polymerase sigma factor [Thermoguttaceae bacterium]
MRQEIPSGIGIINVFEKGHVMTEREAADVFIQNIKFVRLVAYETAPSKSLVEDIVHDTYVFFVENAVRWTNDAHRIKGLLRKITHGVAKDHWRTYVQNLPERLQEVSLYLQKKQTTEDLDQSWSNLEEKVLALRNCMARLSPENRELVEMVYFAGSNYTDIQAKTGTSLDAIYMKMFRIRTALHRCVTQTLAIGVDDE